MIRSTKYIYLIWVIQLGYDFPDAYDPINPVCPNKIIKYYNSVIYETDNPLENILNEMAEISEEIEDCSCCEYE